MKTKGGSSRARQAVELGVTGALFTFGWAVIGAMYVMNRALGGVHRSTPILRPDARGKAEEARS